MPPSWQYHPSEFVVQPALPESDLALRIARDWGGDFRVGLVRHGSRVVALPAAESGLLRGEQGPVFGLALNGRESLFTAHGHLDLPTRLTLLQDADLAVVEGRLDSPRPTILELHPDGSGLEEALASGAKRLVALVGERRPVDKLPPGGIPWFHPDDLEGLLEHLRDLLEAELRLRPLWGIVLGAGHSPLADESRALLSSRCERVFADPSSLAGSADAEPLENVHPRLGELGQILSALESFPSVSFLVVRPEGRVPLVGPTEELLRRRNPLRTATAFREPDTHLPVPAPAVWEPKARVRIHMALAAGIHCPQRVLAHSSLELLEPREV